MAGELDLRGGAPQRPFRVSIDLPALAPYRRVFGDLFVEAVCEGRPCARCDEPGA